jgi:hypothetical protein
MTLPPKCLEANELAQQLTFICLAAVVNLEGYKFETSGAFLQHRLLFHVKAQGETLGRDAELVS